MQLSEDLIRSVVQEVVLNLRNGKAPSPNGAANGWGVFEDVNSAVAAASEAQRAFERRSMDDRRKAVDCIRRICIEQADPLGREEMEETKIGRLKHKIEKLVVLAKKRRALSSFGPKLERHERYCAPGLRTIRRNRRHHACHTFVADLGRQCD